MVKREEAERDFRNASDVGRRIEASYERLRLEIVGALTASGIYMLVDDDPTGPGEVRSAVKRLAAERDTARQEALWLATAWVATGHATPDVTAWLVKAKESVKTLEERLAAAEAEVKRLTIAPCPICSGQPHASGKPCACNGTNSVYTALEYLLGEHERLSSDLEAAQDAHTRAVVGLTGPRCYDPAHGALVERCRRLEEAGDSLAFCRGGVCPSCCAAWTAAKGGKQ